jgi:hypothetical protein
MGAFEVIEQDSILALPDHLNYDPVREHQIRNGIPVLDKFWVINPLTDRVIGDGKSQHRPTNFNLMWESMRQGLLGSSLDLTGVRTQFWGYDDDASFRAEIVLPNHSFEKQLNEPACLKIKVVDSHDQKFRRQVSAMVMRLVCLNGMISMAENTSMSQKHTINSMPEVMGVVASGWPKLLTLEAERMNYLRSVTVSDDDAMEFYITHLASRKTRTGQEVNKARLNYIMMIHDSYNMPGNAYKVYNTLTHLSTHIETQREGTCPMTKQLRMEGEITNIIQGDAFKSLARLDEFPLAA